jgi:ubiquinone/menaquinone biosynthesis C-methylase UbiE
MTEIATYRARLQDPGRAAAYAARFERGSRRRIDRREQRAVRRIFSGLPDCQSVLDVPGGAGRFSAALSQGRRRVLTLDVAFDILKIAQDRTAGAPTSAGFVQGDASRLPLVDGAVDCVFSNRLLHHLRLPAERAVILREFHRVSRRHVVISFFDYHRFERVRRWLKGLKGRRVPPPQQPAWEEFRAELATCGLTVAEVVPTGALWVAQRFLVLRKTGAG